MRKQSCKVLDAVTKNTGEMNMDFEVVEQRVSFMKGNHIIEEEAIAQFKTLERAFDYCLNRDKNTVNVFYVRQK